MAKPKVAFYWCARCGGCEESVVDLAEGVLKVVEAVDIVFWPVALDFKRSDVEAMADGEIAVAFINGAIRNSEQEAMAKLLRKKAGLVIAYGACAYQGGIPGLANLTDKEAILQYVYQQSPSTSNGNGTRPQPHLKVPEGDLELPEFYEAVKTLDQVIDVDYYLPGCPPTAKITFQAIEAILSGKLPEKGAVLAGDRALCYECDLNSTKPEKLLVTDLKRPHQVIIDREKCLLAQGILCLGPVTRGGCEAQCVKGGMPCTGCFGPLGRVRDYGGKALSAIASIVDSTDEKVVAKVFEALPDPAGTFYRYSVPASLLAGKRKAA
ncbi:MAG: oxidoreductase [Acidobacteriia bacterium]|nr:oxidoreductase [Terriglobia bacterium]